MIIEALILTVNAASISVNYQDGWILDGLEFPFAVFVLTYIVYVFSEREMKWMILFASFFRSVLILLPNLKYEWFYGASIDQHNAYRLTQDIYAQSHIPNSMAYADTPFMHLLFVVFSMSTGVPILSSFKYFPVLMWSIYPLIVYAIIQETRVATKTSFLRYALVFSSIPVDVATTYIVTGSSIGVLLSLILVYTLIKLLRTRDRRDWAILAILALALVNSHSFSATILGLVLFSSYIAIRLMRRLFPRKFSVLQLKSLLTTSVFIGLLNLTWLSHRALRISELMADLVVAYIERLIRPSTDVLREPIPLRFFELLKTNIVEGLRVILVWHGATLLLLFMMLLGLFLAAKEIRKGSDSLMFLLIYAVSAWLFLISGLVLRVASGWSERMTRVLLAVSPVFCGLSMSYLNRKLRNSAVLLITVLMVLAAIQLYGCQPLIPSANVINKELPVDVPIGYRVSVNSIYQIDMIYYAEKHIPQNTRIACDHVTRNQIRGLTSWNFSTSHLAWYYPLDKSVPKKEYDYFLIHFPGRSGLMFERAEIRTTSLILQTTQNYSVVYTNGESFMLLNP